MSKFLVFSDLHLYQWPYGSSITPEGYNTRLIDQWSVLSQIHMAAEDEEIDHIFFTGDFFHTSGRVGSQELAIAAKALDMFRKSGKKMVLLVGNHDQSTKTGDIHSLDLFSSYGVVVDRQMTFNWGDFIIHAMPYTEDAEALKRFLDATPQDSIVLMHQGVSGVPVNDRTCFTLNEILQADMFNDNAAVGFSGHYHNYREIIPNRLYIPGAPMQFNWGDRGSSRGYLVCSTSGADVRVKRRYTDAPEFYDINEDEIDNFNPRTGSFIRVHITQETIGPSTVDRLMQYEAVRTEYLLAAGDNDDRRNGKTVTGSFDPIEILRQYLEDYDSKEKDLVNRVISGKYEAPTFDSE
jgi:DNA repair exonuclease SbcCD nuclease subunit